MKLILENTTKIVELNGVPCRVWEGETGNGIKVHAFITPFIASESNANELRAFADKLERDVGHSSWVWNRRIIEEIRAAVGPGAPVTDVDLVALIKKRFEEEPTARGEKHG